MKNLEDLTENIRELIFERLAMLQEQRFSFDCVQNMEVLQAEMSVLYPLIREEINEGYREQIEEELNADYSSLYAEYRYNHNIAEIQSCCRYALKNTRTGRFFKEDEEDVDFMFADIYNGDIENIPQGYEVVSLAVVEVLNNSNI